MDDKRIWFSILVVGIFFHTAASMVMPLGLDAYVHLNYVTDGIDDGSPSLDWGEIRTEGAEYSTPTEVSADDKWLVWHTIIGLWIAVFGNGIASFHMLSLLIFLRTILVFLPDQTDHQLDSHVKPNKVGLYKPFVHSHQVCLLNVVKRLHAILCFS